jgi:hypothetical protein
MIISKSLWTYKELSENWSLKRVQKLINYSSVNKYKDKLALTCQALSKYKAILSLAFLLIFQFSLYDYNYTEYINLSF